MSDNLERVQIAQWVLEKQLAWVAAADAKVAVVVALDTAIFAGLATAYASAKNPTVWASLAAVVAVVVLVVALVCAAVSLFPQTNGPVESLIFFGPVAAMPCADYVAALGAIPLEKLCTDIAAQGHRNAEIAKAKYRWVRRSMAWSFVASLPWIVAVCLLVKQ